jgi:pimeloyl-ACP methyl ester carboxylesterase
MKMNNNCKFKPYFILSKTHPAMKMSYSILFIICALVACNKPVDEIYTQYKQVEEKIVALSGGTMVTSDSLKLIIPPDALPFDCTVFLGRTGKEPNAVPNSNIQVEGHPFTIRIPAGSIRHPIQLEVPIQGFPIDTLKYFLLLFNGSTYFPMAYSVVDNTIHVTIDKIDWENAGNKNAMLASDLIILMARHKQSIPESELGLKKVSINVESGELTFETPTAGKSTRVVLLIHGWTASPEKWGTFLYWFQSDNELLYSEYWTFGYNSSLSINHNGELLSYQLQEYANDLQIDIVAHSMGGLVARSAIENYAGASFINKLITLGSPHEGSPLAVFRYVLGALVAVDDPADNYTWNYNTQGFRDLDTASVFIREMKQLIIPPLPYYTLAAINEPEKSFFSRITSFNFLGGPDDGIVAVSSAHGVGGAVTAESDLYIPDAWAHMKLPEDTTIYSQVINILRNPL